MVKILFYKKLNEKSKDGDVGIEIALEQFSCTLADLPLMTLNQVLYPLK